MIKVLLVEDEADIREIAKMSLELSGDIELVQCASGEEAVHAVRGFIPDVLLLDVMMPGMSGPQTMRKMREMPGLELVPVIFMTARAHEAEHKELWELGAKEIISKPFDPMILGDQIKAVVYQKNR